jgi:hypothetical protein
MGLPGYDGMAKVGQNMESNPGIRDWRILVGMQVDGKNSKGWFNVVMTPQHGRVFSY